MNRVSYLGDGPATYQTKNVDQKDVGTQLSIFAVNSQREITVYVQRTGVRHAAGPCVAHSILNV